MATLTRNLAAFLNTDAEFRAFGQFFHDILAAGGWVQTSDTGQIDLTTVVKPAAINTSQGYEIWRMADAQQSVLPCYMKIEYGSGGVVDRPGLWFTVATGSNGAGTLNGNVGARQQVMPTASKTAGVTLPAYASAATDRFSYAYNYDGAATTFCSAGGIERTCNANGVPTADAILTCHVGANGHKAQIIPPVAVAVPGSNSTGNVNLPGTPGQSGGDLSTINNNVGLIPVIFVCGQPFFMRALLQYKNADITGGTTITATAAGATHTYQCFSSAGITLGSGNPGLALLYE